jgi:thiamine biosynthesis lipoprotein
VLLACLAALISACHRTSSVKFSGETMGTTYTVKVARLPPSIDADRLAADVEARLEEINRQMSTYRDDSEISRLNRFEDPDWFDVSPELLQVLQRATEVSQATRGAFDVTVGPLVRLWNFGPGREAAERVPTDEQIQVARQQIGYGKIEIRETPPGVRKSQPDLELDLSAVAKGFAVDQVAEVLLSHGATDYLVEIGGEVRAGGKNVAGQPWRIGVEAPLAGVRTVQQVVPLSEMAMATSGDYRNFFVVDGKRYSHIIDPRSGRPVEHRLVSVTVLHPSCAAADAWATALLVLGLEEGFAVAERQQLAVLFIKDTDQGFVETSTKEFDRSISEPPAAASRKPKNMFATYLIATTVFVLAATGLAVGMIFGRRQLQCSCKGTAELMGEGFSDPCPNSDGCAKRLVDQTQLVQTPALRRPSHPN